MQIGTCLLNLRQHLFITFGPVFPNCVHGHLIPMKLLCDINLYLCMCALYLCASCVCVSSDVGVGVCTLLWHLEANQCPADYRC